MTLYSRFLFFPLIICSLIFLGLAPTPSRATSSADGRPQQVSLDLTPTTGVPGLADVGYLSSITEAQPFTHMLLRWETETSAENLITLEVRASLDGSSWTSWGAVAEDPDLWQPADGAAVHWGATVYAGEGARFWQVRASFLPASDGSMPTLQRIDVNTVDARFGPQNPSPDASLASISKPSVVSRTAWGNPDGQSSQATPVYYPVNHIVVHHTADSNSLTGSEKSWSDRVRAEWSFHTYTRGWGDVGYNYLIDPNGVVYEGRAGGDDAVAFHDTANYGSMGVSLLGTYTSVEPTSAAQSSLVELLAWKADQKQIDPLGSSYYYGCAHSTYCAPFNAGAVVSNIAGHRQVTPGHTTCPGDSLQTLLPGIRQRVQARMNGTGATSTVDDGDLNIDELESGMVRNSASWHSATCGYGGHSYYTYATSGAPGDEASTNSATWTPNIPTAGSYRVLVHIPQGCAVGTPTASARYTIHASQDTTVTINQGSSDEWVSLGVFSFAAGSSGSVSLADVTGEAFSQGRIVFFDSVKWVAETSSMELLNVQYDRDSVAAGELLKVTFTVKNSGNTTIETQDPQAGTHADQAASFDLSNSYVYDEDECFLGADGASYPVYAKEASRFRVMLGAVEASRVPTCDGDSGGYPWRWGLNGSLAPGETRQIVGYLRFREPGSVTLRAGAIEEYVGYVTRDTFAKTITVTSERLVPVPISYNAQLQPLAHVYTLGSVPDNLLARTQNPLSVVKGDLVGSFAWRGETLDWEQGGPLAGLSDGFIIEQTRVFVVPTTGIYTFQTTSDDGSWLWVDGTAVVLNTGLHGTSSLTGTISLTAGRHVLSFKYFERTGAATAGYSIALPGSTTFTTLIEGLAGSGASVDSNLNNMFSRLRGITIAADDQGGIGIATLRVSFNGNQWTDVSGRVFTLSSMVDGSYTIRYKAVDAAGNESAEQLLTFHVDSTLLVNRVYLPVVVQ
ncbi:MAG: N-acetylmuramoyl-L-alanine amidase [Oscillochloris sp.]|nr:N-acetylmuramoyl-L-alanine amidase [Oscillochloris sp.]